MPKLPNEVDAIVNEVIKTFDNGVAASKEAEKWLKDNDLILVFKSTETEVKIGEKEK